MKEVKPISTLSSTEYAVNFVQFVAEHMCEGDFLLGGDYACALYTGMGFAGDVVDIGVRIHDTWLKLYSVASDYWASVAKSNRCNLSHKTELMTTHTASKVGEREVSTNTEAATIQFYNEVGECAFTVNVDIDVHHIPRTENSAELSNAHNVQLVSRTRLIAEIIERLCSTQRYEFYKDLWFLCLFAADRAALDKAAIIQRLYVRGLEIDTTSNPFVGDNTAKFWAQYILDDFLHETIDSDEFRRVLFRCGEFMEWLGVEKLDGAGQVGRLELPSDNS